MDAEVDGSSARVHPLIPGLVSVRPGTRHEPIDDEVGEPAQQLVDQRAVRRAAGRCLRRRRRPKRMKGLQLPT
ncbi:MAG: hypothetical protein ACYC91_18270 [Solirubrobacteraceae bacterium]